MPHTNKPMEKAKQMYFLLRKLKFGLLKICIMGKALIKRLSVRKLKKVRVIKIDVNRLARRPMVKVTANPLMGPDPNWNSIAPAISDVTCESMIAAKARL